MPQHCHVGQQHQQVKHKEHGNYRHIEGRRQVASYFHHRVVANLHTTSSLSFSIPAGCSSTAAHSFIHRVVNCHRHNAPNCHHPHCETHPTGKGGPCEAGEEAMWQQCCAGARPGGVGVLNEGCKAGEGHPSEDHETYVDVNVEHWGDAVQDQLTQGAPHCPDCAPGIVSRQEGRGEGQHQIGDAQVGQINVDGGE